MGSLVGTGACVGKLSALSAEPVGEPVASGWPWCLSAAFEAAAAEGAELGGSEGCCDGTDEVVVAAADGRGPVGGSVTTAAATALGAALGSVDGGELGGGSDGCIDGSRDGFMLGPYVGNLVGVEVLGL